MPRGHDRGPDQHDFIYFQPLKFVDLTLSLFTMALRDLPWATILFSGVVAAVAYGVMRLIQVRRFYKNLVRGRYPSWIPIEAALTAY